MERDEALQRVASTPGICGGRPCIAGTRIPIEVILANLGDGVSHAELLAAYPALVEEDIGAALAFAADLSRITYEPLPHEEQSR